MSGYVLIFQNKPRAYNKAGSHSDAKILMNHPFSLDQSPNTNRTEKTQLDPTTSLGEFQERGSYVLFYLGESVSTNHLNKERGAFVFDFPGPQEVTETTSTIVCPIIYYLALS